MIQRNGKISCALVLEELMLKWSYHPKQSTDLMYDILKNTHDIFQRTRINNLKIYIESQKTQNCQNNLEKKEQSWRYHIP